MGYTQSVDRKVGQVQIRSKQTEQRTSSASGGSNNAGAGFSVGGQVAVRPQPQVFVQPQPQVFVQPQPQVAVQPQIAPATQQVVRESVTVTNTGTSTGVSSEVSSGVSSGASSGTSSGLDQSALIAQIIALLSPKSTRQLAVLLVVASNSSYFDSWQPFLWMVAILKIDHQFDNLYPS